MLARSSPTNEYLATLVIAFVLSLLPGRAAAQMPQWTVLLVYSDPSLLPASAAFTEGLRQGLPQLSVRLESEFIDFARVATEAEEESIVKFLAERYQYRDIAVVVALGVPASVFTTKFSARIWTPARVIHAGIDGPQLEIATKRGDPVIPRVLDYRRTIEAALTLMPEVREVHLIAGASQQDRRWLSQAEADLAPLRDRIRIVRLAGLRWLEALERVGQLGDDAIGVFVCFFADADGRTFVASTEVGPEVSRQASRPVFAANATWVGHGAVGGYVMDAEAIGRETAGVVISVLNRTDLPVPAIGFGNKWLFDDVQLRRWRLSSANLPVGSVVINREPSLWNQYRWYVLSALSVIAVETFLIGGLLIQRTRRRRAEERSRRLAGRLIGAQESARTQIARDLHDDIGQELASVSLAVGDLRARQRDIGESQTQQALSGLERRTQDLVQGVRRLSHDLHPSTLRHVGLAPALEAHCIEVEQRYDVQVSLKVDTNLRQLLPETAVALYRIVQEALRNAATHGNARRVTVSLSGQDESVELVVADDGQGFDPENVRQHGEGLGLVSIEERAHLMGGQSRVTAAPGRGTTIWVSVPRVPAPGEEDSGSSPGANGG